MTTCAICLRRQLSRLTGHTATRLIHTSSTLSAIDTQQLDPKRKLFDRVHQDPPKPVTPSHKPSWTSRGKKPKPIVKPRSLPDPDVPVTVESSYQAASTPQTRSIQPSYDFRESSYEGPLPPLPVQPTYDFEVPEAWAYAHTEVASNSWGSTDHNSGFANKLAVAYNRDRSNLRQARLDDSEDLTMHDISKIMAEDQGTVEPAIKQTRPDRRREVSNLPPIPADDYALEPENRIAGMVRYNWKSRSPSRLGRQAGKRWYPSLVRRQLPRPAVLTVDDKFYHEQAEYHRHFDRLLTLEYDQERKLFFERLQRWTPEMLKLEGQALFGLSARLTRFQPSGQSTDVEFRLMKKGQAQQLPFHRLELRRDVIISRKDPLKDPARRVGSESHERIGGDVSGQVIGAYKDSLVVRFDHAIEDIEIGKWRLDLGLSDYVYHIQRKAIESLHQNPVAMDAGILSNVTVGRWSSGDRDGTRNETVLVGTALRHILLRAFQEKFKPYHSVAGILPVAKGVESDTTVDHSEATGPQVSLSEHRPSIEDVPVQNGALSDDVVPPTSELKPTDIDAQTAPDICHSDVSHLLYMNQHIHSWACRHMVEGDPVRCEGDPDIPLNPSQIRAIAMMLYNRLSLVQGPPGTGKTRVIIETIKLLKQHWQIPHPILVTAHTNVAVDHLLAGLVPRDSKAGHGVQPIQALRVGPTLRVPEKLMAYTLEAVESEHPLYRDIDLLGVEIEKLYGRSPNGKRFLKDGSTKDKAEALKSERKRLLVQMRSDILTDHDVICTTCIAAGSPAVLRHIDFPFVFLDEASMATEPLSLVPLMKGSSQVAIIGDHKQLPPVIKSEEARFGGLDTSLFERLIHERNNVPRVMLDTQYRMHPAIAAFASQKFYNGDLKNGTVDASGTAWPHLVPPESTYLRDTEGRLRSVMLIHHEHEQSLDLDSLANFHDAEIVVQVVMDLLKRNPDLRGDDIGIIAPYAAQIRHLRALMRSDVKNLDQMTKQIGFDRAREVADIEIKTVDGFEGREKAVIIFSTVRSNPGGWIGFLADWRRLNVGITRAKRALVIIGDVKTLENARIGPKAEDHLPSGGPEVWRDFIQYLRAQGQIKVYSEIEKDLER